MDKRSAMERSRDIDELGRIVCVLEACSRLLGEKEPHFPASGKSVGEVLHNMAKAVQNYEAAETEIPCTGIYATCNTEDRMLTFYVDGKKVRTAGTPRVLHILEELQGPTVDQLLELGRLSYQLSEAAKACGVQVQVEFTDE